MPAATRSSGSPGKPLVIVESPAKARTIASLLGGGFVVESSVGHIRDLPRRADEIPSAYKGEGWARLGVDVDNGFKPLYVVASEKKSVVARLKSLLAGASEVYLATDEDREGESIAWHLTEVLSPRVPIKRMVFHEITAPALRRAVEEWRDLDRRLVDAQEARRILDRLYGYEVSPVLWKKVMPRLSAGRVQSVATRMIVERERARMRFRAGTWWDLEGRFDSGGQIFTANLVAVGGTSVATGRDFTETGELSRTDVVLLSEPEATRLAQGLAGQTFTVRSVSEKPYRRSPAPPFMTSTLQQEASRKLRFGAQRTMQVAQRLYEQGWITYMRTDSTTLSDQALTAARSQASALYGREYVPEAPRRYERKVKNAQEAHEAIRPAGEAFRTPEEAGHELHGDTHRLYDLIWKRTVASQMADATGTSAQVRLVGVPQGGAPADEAEFSASGTVIGFAGFLRAYVEGSDDPEAETAERDVQLPALVEGDTLSAQEIDAALAHHPAPGPLHRGVARQGPRGAGRGAAFHLRQHPGHHPDSRVRVEEGHRPGAVVHGLRCGRPARAVLRGPRRLRIHRGDGERPRRDRRRRAGGAPLAHTVLFRGKRFECSSCRASPWSQGRRGIAPR